MAEPYSKDKQLARGERRYHRHVASPKEWQRIVAEKTGPCRVCGSQANGRMESRITFHHIVSRAQGGDDVAENIAPVCLACHERLTRHEAVAEAKLYEGLTAAERAYMERKR